MPLDKYQKRQRAAAAARLTAVSIQADPDVTVPRAIAWVNALEQTVEHEKKADFILAVCMGTTHYAKAAFATGGDDEKCRIAAIDAIDHTSLDLVSKTQAVMESERQFIDTSKPIVDKTIQLNGLQKNEEIASAVYAIFFVGAMYARELFLEG